MADIEILHIGDKKYVSFEDAASYLGCSLQQTKDYVYLERIQAERLESRWLIDWQSLQTFARLRGQKSRVG